MHRQKTLDVLLKEQRRFPEPSEALRRSLSDHVRKVISPIASPDVILFSPGLPKTRSGKIMRRILRKIARGDAGDLGDISILADAAGDH